MKKVFAFMAIAAMVFVACNKNDDPNKGKEGGKEEGKEQEEEKAKVDIKIDGDFADWAAINPEYVAVAKNDPNSKWEGVAEIRCCANADFVFYYIKYDKETVEELLSLNDVLPIRLNINTYGEFESGYTSYSLDGYDFILEGSLGNGEGGWGNFEPEMHQRIGGWVSLAPSTSGICSGAGAGHEYEILVSRDLFNNAALGSEVPMPMGDVFQTGVRFYETTVGNPGHWEELSNMPNSSIDVEESGYGHLLEVAVIK